MPHSSPDTIVAQFDPNAGQWVAYFRDTPQVAFGGNLPMVSVRRLLEGTEASAATYELQRDIGRSEGLFIGSLTWDPPEILISCEECRGTGQYVGLIETGPCKACGGRRVQLT